MIGPLNNNGDSYQGSCQQFYDTNRFLSNFHLETLTEKKIKFKLAEYLSKKVFIQYAANLNPFNAPTNSIREYLRAQTLGTPLFVRDNFEYEISDEDRLYYGDGISLIADKKIKSILANYDWTTSQHLIGANFGAQNCGQYNADQIETYSCNATSIEQDQVLGNSTINQDTNTHQIDLENLSGVNSETAPVFQE